MRYVFICILKHTHSVSSGKSVYYYYYFCILCSYCCCCSSVAFTVCVPSLNFEACSCFSFAHHQFIILRNFTVFQLVFEIWSCWARHVHFELTCSLARSRQADEAGWETEIGRNCNGNVLVVFNFRSCLFLFSLRIVENENKQKFCAQMSSTK